MMIMLNEISTCFRIRDDFLCDTVFHIIYVTCNSRGKAKELERTVLKRALWCRNVAYLFECSKIQTVIVIRNSM